MPDWGFVILAYSVVWGGLALYALALVRRLARVRFRAPEPAATESRAVLTSAGGSIRAGRPADAGTRSLGPNRRQPAAGE